MEPTRSGDSPMDGSSSTSIRGRDMRARPIASICCWPPESVPACLALIQLTAEDLAALDPIAGQVSGAARPDLPPDLQRMMTGAEQ
jgi:hypothetical protein